MLPEPSPSPQGTSSFKFFQEMILLHISAAHFENVIYVPYSLLSISNTEKGGQAFWGLNL